LLRNIKLRNFYEKKREKKKKKKIGATKSKYKNINMVVQNEKWKLYVQLIKRLFVEMKVYKTDRIGKGL